LKLKDTSYFSRAEWNLITRLYTERWNIEMGVGVAMFIKIQLGVRNDIRYFLSVPSLSTLLCE